MAAVAVCKRVGQIGTNSGIIGGVSRFRGFASPNVVYLLDTAPFPPSAVRLSASSAVSFSQSREISQLVKSNGKRLFLVDTLALVRRLEAEGLPSKQAEAITAAITEVLNDSLENVAVSVVSKVEMQKCQMIQDSNLSKLKSEVQSSQGHHFSLLQHETEKLRGDIEKMQSELRHEIDKVTAGQRLDLNLERGRIQDELTNQSTETANLTNKLDREIHALKAHLEGAKYDLIKYCIGTLVSMSAVGLATGHHFSLLQHETEKLWGDIEKMRSELRHEIDKFTAGQRLDLNLERGRIQDELTNQSTETANLTNKLDREIHALKAQLEGAKYDLIKYCIGTLVSISAVGLATVVYSCKTWYLHKPKRGKK